jgi:hypothetical protein
MLTIPARAAIALLFGMTAYAQSPVAETTRVYSFRQMNTQGLQEVATVFRTVLSLQTVVVDDTAHTITIGASPVLAATADWLAPLLNKGPVDSPSGAQPVLYTVPDGQDDVVEVYNLANVATAQGTQELLTILRTVVTIDKIFNVTGPRALAFRGTSSTVAMADWLVRQIDTPKTVPVSGLRDYPVSGGQVLRVLYLVNHATPRTQQEMLTAMRVTNRSQNVFNFSSAPQAIALRGTPQQAEAARQIVAAKDIPPSQ